MKTCTVGIIALLIVATVGGAAERLTIHHSELRVYGATRRVAVRFDLSRLGKGARIDRATLHLGEMKPSQPVEIRPATTAWGYNSPAYMDREKRGIWTEADLKRR